VIVHYHVTTRCANALSSIPALYAWYSILGEYSQCPVEFFVIGAILRFFVAVLFYFYTSPIVTVPQGAAADELKPPPIMIPMEDIACLDKTTIPMEDITCKSISPHPRNVKPVMVHLDSLGCHDGEQLCDNLRVFFNFVWSQKKGNSNDIMFTKHSLPIIIPDGMFQQSAHKCVFDLGNLG